MRHSTHTCLSFVGYQIDTLPYFLVFRSKRADRVFFIAYEEYLGVVALSGCTGSCGDHTHWLASCDPPLLFVYLQVNTGVSMMVDLSVPF